MAIFFDTHAHLDWPEFSADLPEVLARATKAGVEKIITIGTTLESAQRAIALAQAQENVYAAVGWHPSYVADAPPDVRAQLKELASNPKVVALGETGLDYHRLPSASGGSPADDAAYKQKQAEIFEQHLQVAAELGLNCVIHQRDALDDTLSILKPYASKVRGVFHCFVDAPAAAQKVLALGSLVSFTGICTFKNAELVRQAIQSLELSEFMVETDAPFLAPVPYRGKRCEPAYVADTAQAIAKVKECSLDALSEATCATARAFFKGL